MFGASLTEPRDECTSLSLKLRQDLPPLIGDYMRVLVRKNVVWTAWIHFDHLHQDGDDYWTKLGGHPFGQKDHDRLLDANGDEIYTDLGVKRLVDMKHLVGTAHGAIFTPKPRQNHVQPAVLNRWGIGIYRMDFLSYHGGTQEAGPHVRPFSNREHHAGAPSNEPRPCFQSLPRGRRHGDSYRGLNMTLTSGPSDPHSPPILCPV